MKRTHIVKIMMSKTSGTEINLYDYVGEDKGNQLFYKKGEKYYGIVILSKKSIVRYKKHSMFYSREYVKGIAKQWGMDLMQKERDVLNDGSIFIYFEDGSTKQFKDIVRLDSMSDKLLSFYYKDSKRKTKKVLISNPKFECDHGLKEGTISNRVFFDCPVNIETYSEFYGCLSYDTESVLSYKKRDDGTSFMSMNFRGGDGIKLPFPS